MQSNLISFKKLSSSDATADPVFGLPAGHQGSVPPCPTGGCDRHGCHPAPVHNGRHCKQTYASTLSHDSGPRENGQRYGKV